MFFRMNFALFFRFFDSWYIINTYWLRPRESSMFCGPSTVDVSLGFALGNIDSLGSTKHTVSLGLSH